MMEQQQTLSLWVGTLPNAAALQNYIEVEYTDDGEMSSEFMQDFGIAYYDTAFAEVLFATGTKQEVFKDFSYAESFIDNLPDIDYGMYNSFILLYNFAYMEVVQQAGNVYFAGIFQN